MNKNIFFSFIENPILLWKRITEVIGVAIYVDFNPWATIKNTPN